MKRKLTEKRYKEMLTRERMEKYSQSINAQGKVLEENDRVLTIIGERINDLKASSKISREVAKNLNNLLKIHKSSDENRQVFLQEQRELDTRFSEQLKIDFLDLSESQIKLASFVAAGLDNAR